MIIGRRVHSYSATLRVSVKIPQQPKYPCFVVVAGGVLVHNYDFAGVSGKPLKAFNPDVDCVGVASSRRIAQRLHEDIAFRVLAANNTPDFRTISDFRKDNLDALSGLFLQVLALCQRAGLVKLGHVALDGTKVRANASGTGR